MRRLVDARRYATQHAPSVEWHACAPSQSRAGSDAPSHAAGSDGVQGCGLQHSSIDCICTGRSQLPVRRQIPKDKTDRTNACCMHDALSCCLLHVRRSLRTTRAKHAQLHEEAVQLRVAHNLQRGPADLTDGREATLCMLISRLRTCRSSSLSVGTLDCNCRCVMTPAMRCRNLR